MPDESSATTRPIEPAELTTAVAAAVREVSGLVRLEPSMQESLRRLRSHGSALVGRPATAVGVDGVVLTRRGPQLTVAVDIVTDPAHCAGQVADTVQRRAHAVLAAAGHQRVTVNVSVLSVEPAAGC